MPPFLNQHEITSCSSWKGSIRLFTPLRLKGVQLQKSGPLRVKATRPARHPPTSMAMEAMRSKFGCRVASPDCPRCGLLFSEAKHPIKGKEDQQLPRSRGYGSCDICVKAWKCYCSGEEQGVLGAFAELPFHFSAETLGGLLICYRAPPQVSAEK